MKPGKIWEIEKRNIQGRIAPPNLGTMLSVSGESTPPISRLKYAQNMKWLEEGYVFLLNIWSSNLRFIFVAYGIWLGLFDSRLKMTIGFVFLLRVENRFVFFCSYTPPEIGFGLF